MLDIKHTFCFDMGVIQDYLNNFCSANFDSWLKLDKFTITNSNTMTDNCLLCQYLDEILNTVIMKSHTLEPHHNYILLNNSANHLMEKNMQAKLKTLKFIKD